MSIMKPTVSINQKYRKVIIHILWKQSTLPTFISNTEVVSLSNKKRNEFIVWNLPQKKMIKAKLQ